MPADVDVAVCLSDGDPSATLDSISGASGRFVLVHRPGIDVAEEALDAMVVALAAPMAATASPVPVAAGNHGNVSAIALDPRLPPVATLAEPCPEVCLIDRAALGSVGRLPAGDDWEQSLAAIARRLVAAGWRHVAAPGALYRWTPSDSPLNGAANEGLTTHRLWADTRLRGARVVVDGACLTDDPHNGSQAVVWNVASALARTRPDASISLAVPGPFVAHLRGRLDSAAVQVVERDADASGFDVVYRPYQPLDPGELEWMVTSGARLLTSQLDMIAFSNPSYHPSATLFHAVRNLQRRTMRLADGVTFISEFGRQAALAECPDLDVRRTFVVSCGADAKPPAERRATPDVAARMVPLGTAGGRFIACTSATFWHKNRQHAIRVFDELCRRHAYAGSLVIAGPEPFYGRSTGDDDTFVRSLDESVRSRVIMLGQVDDATKWWLLEHADLVLYPSVVEGFGLVPFESAAVGTPCLAYSGSALREVLTGTRALVDSWLPERWAETAAELLDKSSLSDRLVDEVRAVAAERTWDATAGLVWDAIDTVLAAPRALRTAEEGGVGSRVAGATSPLAPAARLTHFANRVRSYAERRLAR